MNLIFLSIRSKKQEVEAFLNELNDLLKKKNFNPDTDLILIRKRKQGEDQKYSTPYTLLQLEYDMNDVADRLRELTTEEYSETKIDTDDTNPPLLFVFGKYINKRLVYVKLKIKGEEKKRILCVSFHFAKEEMTFPYKTMGDSRR